VEINDPTHLTGLVCVDASHDEEKYQDFGLSGCPEEDRRGDRHLSGTRQRLCVDIYHVIYYVMNDAELSRLECRFLTISSTSCPVERLFSVTGQVDAVRNEFS
jgi:hypothetical protein